MSDNLVYSTDKGDLRKRGGNKGRKSNNKSPSPHGTKNDGTIRVQREKKGRAGKTVTAIYNLPLKGPELSDLAKRIKQKCGSGGSVKDGVVIIQGGKIERVITCLQHEGHSAKRSGG